MSSVVAVQGLRCLGACGILVPQPGIEPSSPALDDGFLTTGLLGKSFLHVGSQLFQHHLMKIIYWACD